MAEVKTSTFPMTCIICPMGCTLEVTLEDDGVTKKVTNVCNNGCKRGPEYVRKEFTFPTRTLTSTVGVCGGNMNVVPCKSKGEVPKNMLFQCMEIVRRTCVKAPVKRGDVLIQDILETGVDVIACADVKAKK